MIIAFVNIYRIEYWEYIERTNNHCENLLSVKVKRNTEKKKKIGKHWFKWSKNRKMGDRRIYKVLSTVDRPIAMWDFCSCSHLGQWEKSALTENTAIFSLLHSKRQCLCNIVSIVCIVDSLYYDILK